MSSESPLPVGTIRLRGVQKTYDRAARKPWTSALPWGTPPVQTELKALDDLNLEIQPGESVGLIGANGAGKSTVLKLLAGVIDATEGEVACVGRIGSMIELGLGFHNELTGRENARISATILGLTPAQATELAPEMIAFAGIEDAMDTPLKHYSTGMRARLGFAVAVHVPTDVLLIDEVLSVGDSEFQLRCVDRITEMHAAGTTLVFVSHATWLVSSVCERVVQLRRGRVVDDGPSAEVIQRYLMPAPTELKVAEAPCMEFRQFALTTERVKSWGRLEFEADVVVTAETAEPAIALDLSWATLAPDITIARTTTPMPEVLKTPGGYRLRGTSSRLPVDSGGHAQARVALVDESTQRLFGLETGEFWIVGPVLRQQPQLATEVNWSIEPEDAEAGLGTATEASASTNGLESGLTTPSATSPSSELLVECHHLTKRFHKGLRRGGFRLAYPGPVPEPDRDTEIVALDDVDLSVPRGQSLGIMGPNGSGKSTLLKAIAGVLAPSSGEVTTRGRLVPMLELGIGFHADLTGEENVRQTGRLLGLTKAELAEAWDRIVDFADIGNAIGAPVKQYSSGMKARLGLALALNCSPELILIDEVLAVGDHEFQEKALDAVRQLVADGATSIFVSHEASLVEELCNRVIRLEQGRIVDDGPASEVIDRAGGTGWTGGVMQLTSPVRVDDLVLRPRHVPPGGLLEFDGTVEVFEPSPTVRLEFSYLARTNNPNKISAEDLAANTVLKRVVVPAGGPLSDVGRYRFHGSIPENLLLGECYAMVSAVDEREALLVAQAWQDLKIGTPRQAEVLTFALDVDWELLGEFDPAESLTGSGGKPTSTP